MDLLLSLWHGDVAMRHRIRPRPEVRGVTPRRVAVAQRALARERERYALFLQELEQETPAQRITRFDEELLAADQQRRDLAAQHWRKGRRWLRCLAKSQRPSLRWSGD